MSSFLPLALGIMLVVLHLFIFKVSSHFLSALLVLEGMVLLCIIFLSATMSMVSEGMSVYLFFLTLSVAEASMGLSLLMGYVKVNGNDLIKNYIP
uniref:NADH dehydrogenase subunit 4L n=1 Tax=Zaptyx hirasei TaxID=1885886 RepID=A0A224AAA4_9EUPU|nr:NADH dehydrogenase subunit 4L [Zaptyx hirasei]